MDEYFKKKVTHKSNTHIMDKAQFKKTLKESFSKCTNEWFEKYSESQNQKARSEYCRYLHFVNQRSEIDLNCKFYESNDLKNK